ncbi:MAG: hypothetical protein JSC085_000352 [Candidatus Tokpelaia sp. JSC085]|nr:MAG: hypothetical protein JSC085_000352 [Candidatus Tokpelaia sp. JSC085]
MDRGYYSNHQKTEQQIRNKNILTLLIGVFSFLLIGSINKIEAREGLTTLEDQVVPQPKKNMPSKKTVNVQIPSYDKRAETGTQFVTVSRKKTKRILIVGDFIARDVAEGLMRVYDEKSEMTVLAKIEGSSGFVRNDYYDWPARIYNIIIQKDPDIILVLLGSNDRQVIKSGRRTLDILSSDWIQHYNSRILSFATVLKKSGRPWIWLGLPSFKKKNLDQNSIQLNAYFRHLVENTGGYFVDIRRGFVDENDNFILSGYDINGNIVQLRTNDGINFTSSGRRKLALYADKAIRFLVDKKVSEPTEQFDQFMNVEHIAPTDIWEIGRSTLDLAGAMRSLEKIQHDRKRIFSRSYNGRADDFSLKKGEIM